MSSVQSVKRPYQRPVLVTVGPDRRAGGFYRSADREERGLAGVSLSSTEAVMVAAVRMGYRIAEEQIDRSANAARRLRNAAERAAGPESERQVVEATERLIFKSMLAGLSWFETIAANPTHPLRKLATAEFDLLARLFGFRPYGDSQGEASKASDESPLKEAAAAPATRPVTQPRIILVGTERRAVRVVLWAIAGPVDAKVAFYFTEAPDCDPITGEVRVPAEGQPTLSVTTSRQNRAGTWRAPVCNGNDEQVGIVEIVL
jgi:hypothetical protein